MLKYAVKRALERAVKCALERAVKRALERAVKRALKRAVKRARALERALSYFEACSFYIINVTATNAGACIEAPVDLQALSYLHASVKWEMRRHRTWVFI